MNPEQNRTEQNKPEKTSGRKKPSRELTKQEEFIKNHRRHHHEIASWRTVIFVLFLALWEISAGCGWIDSFFFSSPSRVARCFADQLRNNSMLSHIGVTLFETLLSFLLVLLFSLLISTMLWYSAKLSEILEPYLVVLNSLPKSALAPLLIVWLGANYKTIILTGMSVAVFGSVLSLYTGFQEVDAEKIKLIYTLNGTSRDALYKVILPANVPNLFSIMKVNIGLCLVGVIIGEFLAARMGLGYLIIYGSQVFQLDMVLMSIVILCIMAMILYQAVNLVEKHCLKWF